jgi:arylsulfatase A-like enzyme
MDLLPTFARLAGATLPADRVMDGRDITPMLKGGRTEQSRELFWQSGTEWTVRLGPWKLTGQRKNLLSLVNLSRNIGEADNLLTPKTERAEQLMKAHAQWVKFLHD